MVAFDDKVNLAEAGKLCDRVAVMEEGQLVAIGTTADLARQVVRRLPVEIELAPEAVSEAARILEMMDVDLQIQQTNSTIELFGLERAMIPTVVSALAVAGLPIYRIEPQEPSLKDVYFALQGRKERAR